MIPEGLARKMRIVEGGEVEYLLARKPSFG